MADEDKTVVPNNTEPKVEEPKLSAAEVQAMEQGWVPKEQWEGDPDQWRPAREFLDRGELFRKIEDQNRTIKDFKKALNDLQKHHQSVRETEYKRAIEALKHQKKIALNDGDADTVVEIDDQIDLVKREQDKLRQEPVKQEAEELNPEFAAWVDKNKWYNSDEGMRGYADGIGRTLAKRGMSPAEVLKEVEKQVRENFPNKFRNPNRDKPGNVEGSSNQSGGKAGNSFQLSEDERRVMQRFIRTIPGFSEKQYIEELKRVKGA